MTARKAGLLLAGLGAAALGLLYAVLGGKSKKLAPGRLPTVLVGDSLAIGLTTPLRMAGLPIHSIAIGGTTIAYWASTGKARLDAELASKPTSIMVSLGTNDAYNVDSYAPIVTPITAAFLKRLSDAGAFVFWIGPPKLPTSYNGHTLSQSVLSTIRAVVDASQDAIWIDSSALNIERQSDQLHPTEAGYAQWADYIIDLMAQSFVQPNATSVGDVTAAQPEPTPRPPPPVTVTVPTGWRRLKTVEPGPDVSNFAISILVRGLPYGDVRAMTTAGGGKALGALTDTHWDDHVGGTWKWHRGISLLEPIIFSQADIIQAARDGRLQYHWADLPGYDGVQVFEDAARIDGLRVPVSARTTAAIVEILSAALQSTVTPTTPLVEDILYNMADVKVRPMPQQVDSPASAALFTNSLDRQISQLTSGRPGWGIVSCVGKSWVLSNMAVEHPGKAINYGMHWPLLTGTTSAGPWPSIDGKSKVFQQPGSVHDPDHYDYSQTLRLCKLAPGAQLPSHEPLRATKLWY